MARREGLEGAFDPASGKIAYHEVPANLPPQLVPLVINQETSIAPGIMEPTSTTSVHGSVSPTTSTIARSSRGGFGVYYDNLNLNELQFTRLVPPFYGQFSLTPVRTAPVQVDTLFPNLDQIPQFPAPFSLDPINRTAYTMQWNGNVQRTLARSYMVEVAYTGSRSYNEHKRFNINQATARARRPSKPACRIRRSSPPFCIRPMADGPTSMACRSVSEKRYSSGLFFLANYQLSKTVDNGSGEIEANDTAFAWDLDADKSLSRFDQRHRSAFSYGYELPFGSGRRWLSERRRLGTCSADGRCRASRGSPADSRSRSRRRTSVSVVRSFLSA